VQRFFIFVDCNCRRTFENLQKIINTLLWQNSFSRKLFTFAVYF